MQTILIISLSLACSIFYGLIFDQITIRICLEYFTVGHPPIFSLTSPTVLAIKWAITATWWMGIILGAGLAFFARAGNTPPVSVDKLVLPILRLMGLMFVCAIVMGVIGYVLGYCNSFGSPSKICFANYSRTSFHLSWRRVHARH